MDTLGDADITRLKNVIDARDRELRDELGGTLGQAGDQRYLELAGTAHDPGDESVANELMDLENSQTQRSVGELRALELARSRLRSGEINVCIECGRAIGLPRLLANPTALRCIECQTIFEKTHAAGAPPRL